MKTRKLNMKSLLLCILLVISMLATTLTGCGNAGTPNDTSASSEVDSSSELDTSTETETQSKPESFPTGGNKDDSTESTETESESETQSQNPDTSTDNNNNTTGNNAGNNNTGNTGTTNNNTNNNSNTGNTNTTPNTGSTSTPPDFKTPGISLSQIPAYKSGTDYITLNNGTPHFSTSNLSTTAVEYYSELDSLGRCGVAYACLGPELLPTEERGDINSVTPSGWVSSDGSGNSLYNRSHLIAFSLAGENANSKNLITGTSHMNQYTMQIFENQVLDYINETGKHVMYRVTPFFEGNNLVATGVQMEAWSIEDNGVSICFNVFCYNVQDGVSIDYATGNYSLEQTNYQYIVNGNNGKIHTYACGIKSNMSNPIYCETLEEAIAESERILGSAVGAGCCKPLP